MNDVREVVLCAFQPCELDVLFLRVAVEPVLPLQLFVEDDTAGETVLLFQPDVTALPVVTVLPVLRSKIALAPFWEDLLVQPELVLVGKVPP